MTDGKQNTTDPWQKPMEEWSVDDLERAIDAEQNQTTMADIDSKIQDALDSAESDVRDGAGFDQNSYGAGYDCGYRDAMRRALCILRGLDDE